MRLPGGRTFEVVGVALAVSAFAVLLVFALLRLVEVERDTHAGSKEGVVWAVGQAQYEIQRLLNATNPLNAPSGEEVSLRFDVALSRLQLLEEGAFGERIAEIGGSSVIERAKASLLSMEPLILSSGNEVDRYNRRLARIMPQHVVSLGSVGNELMIKSSVEEGDRRARYSQTLGEVIIAVLGITLTGSFLVFRLIGSLRQADRAEATLRREKNFLSLLLESSGEGICAFDGQCNCTHWNEGMTKMFGVEAADILGKPLLREGFSPDGALTAELLAATLEGGTTYLPAQLSESGAYLEHTICPIQLKGNTIGGIIIVRDVTQRYEALRERQLREVYRDFISMVSHQFRTPLAIIDSTVQRIMRRHAQMDREELLGRAGTIRQAVTGLAQLMDSTLSAARLDSGEMALSLHEVDLAGLLEQVRTRFAVVEPARDIQLDASGLGATVTCDALLLDQVITNLVGNALKYSPADRPVTVTASEADGWVTISVADRGVGIPVEDRDRLFERFFRASNTTTFPGTGVGLYVSRQIARLHGGDIAVSDGPDGGTVFTLRLPLSIAPAEAIA